MQLIQHLHAAADAAAVAQAWDEAELEEEGVALDQGMGEAANEEAGSEEDDDGEEAGMLAELLGEDVAEEGAEAVEPEAWAADEGAPEAEAPPEL